MAKSQIFDLTNHVALITGGNGGLGLAMARGLVKAGASIAIWGRNADKNAAAVAELMAMGGDAAAFVCDVTDNASCAAAFTATIERFGKIDSCFANAGGSGVRGPFHRLSEADWASTNALNVASVITTFQIAIRHWLECKAPGKLIVTSSIAGLMGIPQSSGYSMTKAAVQGLIRSLAIEYGRAGIQANAILPGFIETEMSLDTPQYFQDGCKRRAASGEIGQLEDMEGIAVYLASRESRFMTGQCIVLDGGHTIFPL
ncbi:MAG: SDR family oxidoreductase [Sphingopyxis sp.]|nr:SDR family oxidoreductase [Sphingopyxis sp.]